MAPSTVHLPNGQNYTVTPVFGGLSFKANDYAANRSTFPPGWTVILNEEDSNDDAADNESPASAGASVVNHSTPADVEQFGMRRSNIHRYKKPTLQHDHLYISQIMNPSSADFRPVSSPTRHIAMMLWSSLWWYFHQPEPSHQLHTKAAINTPDAGKPRGEWLININREGIFKGKNILAKLERMGLITTEDSSVGTDPDTGRTGQGWTRMFVSRRAFWQIDARIFLFTLPPAISSPFPGGTPFSSRPSSPIRTESPHRPGQLEEPRNAALVPSPFHSNSHLPTYYPPHPPQFTFTNGIRHPIRPKPHRQGEMFYCRYVPSIGQYLSFRVASLSSKPPSRIGPWTVPPPALGGAGTASQRASRSSLSDSLIPTMTSIDFDAENDIELLHKWMNEPRVNHSWGEAGPIEHQEEFLRAALSSRHSFPVIGCFDGKPFGYFEIYWVKEDVLGKYLGGNVDHYDRGIHCLVGEQDFRGPHRVRIWLSALVHHCWLDDMRTSTVMLEPRVDNTKLAQYCMDVGFYKEREVTFPHKQSNLFKVEREAWENPFI